MIDQFFPQALLLLGAGVAVVVAFQRLHIPSSLGYLLVGVLFGPHPPRACHRRDADSRTRGVRHRFLIVHHRTELLAATDPRLASSGTGAGGGPGIAHHDRRGNRGLAHGSAGRGGLRGGGGLCPVLHHHYQQATRRTGR